MKATCVLCHSPSVRLSCGRRIAGFFRWLLPGALLVLMPKCPACFAAYIALAGGIGLSLPVASFLRLSLIVLCVVSLALLVFGVIRRRRFGRKAMRT